jgi:23S rRNA pseudouridine1911/1915/1917 synthase
MTSNPNQPIAFQVVPSSTERLDRFLADQLAMSRTQAARILGEGGVRVNREPARASQTLKRGDIVQVSLPQEQVRREILPLVMALSVVFEDEHLLVLDKPAGLVVHPAPGHWDDTLVNALAARGMVFPREDAEARTPELADPPIRRSADPLRPGIVHRLDKDTSGLLIVAKTESAHRKLSHALGLRRIERTYAVLIWGHLKKEQEIDAPIARSARNRKQMAIVASGRAARTRWSSPSRGSARVTWCGRSCSPGGPIRSGCTWPTSGIQSSEIMCTGVGGTGE